jgi:hypothetical protein
MTVLLVIILQLQIKNKIKTLLIKITLQHDCNIMRIMTVSCLDERMDGGFLLSTFSIFQIPIQLNYIWLDVYILLTMKK